MTGKRAKMMCVFLLLLLSSWGFVNAIEQGDKPVMNRDELARTMQNGNWKDALEGYQALLKRNNGDGALAAQDLQQALLCFDRLGRGRNHDELIELALEHQSQHWQVLLEAGKRYSSGYGWGGVIDGSFQRGNASNQWVFVGELDRVRAINLILEAIEKSAAVAGNEIGPDKARLFIELAMALAKSRTGQSSWRLQSLTDLNEELDYTVLDRQQSWPNRNAPVDRGGAPLFYEVPGSWEAASSDGQRYRWAIEQARKCVKPVSDEADLQWADFCRQQFSVQTLASYSWFRPALAKDADERDSVAVVHTLAENETIARLANGPKRFELPKECDYIAMYRGMTAEGHKFRRNAFQNLANIFLNRRQYVTAAEVLQQQIQQLGDNGPLKRQLANIIEPRGKFDSLPTQLAGENPTIGFVYRNSSKADFTARRVDVETLIADNEKYYRDWKANGKRPSKRSFPRLDNPTALFSSNRVAQRLVGEPIQWSETLQERQDHWDSRFETEAPISDAGLYLVDVVLRGDQKTHKARCLVWLQDTAIVRVPTDNGLELHVADSGSGLPVQSSVEVFGFRWKRNRQGRTNQIELVERTLETDTEGVARFPADLLNKDWQIFTTVRSKAGGDKRLAFFDWERFYARQYQSEKFTDLKAYGVSDRPMYRPGEIVKTTFWLGRSSYAAELKNLSFAGQPVNLELYDPKGAKVATREMVADEFGRVSSEFALPESTPLGRYSFRIAAGKSGYISSNLDFRVEEYRKPEFEVSVDAPSGGVALGETFKAKVSARYYFGSPVTDAEVTVKVNRTEYSDAYYPVDPFDWCYGPGYWWWAYSYDWYPGFNRWRGCLPPVPVWWGVRSQSPPELVLEESLQLDENGEAFIEIDTALAKKIYGESDHQYQISVEVRDASRRTILGDGAVIASREPFKIYSWGGRGYYLLGDTIEANFHARTLRGDAIESSGTLDLLRVAYDADRQPVERVVASWEVATDAQGRLQHEMEAGRAGQYRVRLRLKTKNGGEVEGGYLLTIRGNDPASETVSGDDFRFGGLELIPQKRNYAPGEKLRLQINSDRNDALVHLFVRPDRGVYTQQKVIQLNQKTSVVEIDVRPEDQPNFFVEAYTVFDGSVYRQTREIMVPPAKRVLDVQISSDKKEYLPGESAKLNLRVIDAKGEPVEGAFAIAVYDRALEQIASDVLPEDIRSYFWKWRRNHFPSLTDNLGNMTSPIGIKGIDGWRALGLFGNGTADQQILMPRRAGIGGGALGMAAKSTRMMAPESAMTAPTMLQAADAPIAYSDGSGGPADDGALGGATPPKVRQDFADSAYWLVGVETDANGVATAEFQMPENLGSWQMRAWTVTKDLQVGSSVSQALTRKNLMVRLQKPRFLVERDEVLISAIVNNDFDSPESVSVRLEIDGETSMQLMEGVNAEQAISVDGHGSVRVDWRCKAIAEGNVTLRTFAIGSSESDAMQDEMPVVVNGILKTETWAGTVRDGTDDSRVAIRVPAERRPEQSKLTVRVSPSLAASMIDSLPYLVDFPYGCTEQTLNRFLPTVITQRTLQRMNVDLAALANQRANLNAQELPRDGAANRPDRWRLASEDNPVYSEAKVNEMAVAGVNRLAEMQLADGGWGWFSGVRAVGYPHTTAVVVRGLILARDNGCEVPPGVIERGIDWLRKYQQRELQKLANAESKTAPFKSRADELDALVLNVLAMTGSIDSKTQEKLYEDRLELSVYGKVLLALVAHQSGDVEQTKMLRKNIEQFLEQDETNETAYLTTGDNWWYWYGDSIESNAMYLKLLSALDPKGVTAPRLVKYLLNNRRHATYWKSTRDTALVVEAFADYLQATQEIAGNSRVVVELDGQRLGQVDFTPETLFSADNTIEVTGRALSDGEHELVIRREGGGNLYWNAYLTNFTQEEEIESAGLEVTVQRRYYSLTPTKRDLELPGQSANVVDTKKSAYDRRRIEDLDQVPSGSIVEVELIVESKNDYEYLIIEDNKAACLEAIDTQSGYANVGGRWVYQELRDQKIAFFLNRLNRGTHSLRYQVRVEAPGRFTALPAKIMAMYAPELQGNSSDFDFVTRDAIEE